MTSIGPTTFGCSHATLGVLRLDDRMFVAVVRYGDIVVWHYTFRDHWFKVNATSNLEGALVETTGPKEDVPPFAFNCDPAMVDDLCVMEDPAPSHQRSQDAQPHRIEIVAYDPAWPGRFAELGRELRGGLGNIALRIDHIGSTSVPGLAAKPIIDLQVSVASFEPLEAFRKPLERLGYVYRADNPERTKRYFREPPGRQRTHVHVRRAGSFSEQWALLFRDYLRAHRAVAAEYEAVKRRLAIRFPDDRQAYTDAKGPFLWEIIRRADEWAQAQGWLPGPSDT
jgi:GrpB-like predicted nucleotidyltransferase (UPF0157 family)